MSDRDSARQRIERKAIADFEKRPKNTAVRKTGRPVRETHEPAPTTEWFVVIPVKGTGDAKSRLGATEQLALAIALDTVEAALAAPGVTGVVVVTSESASAMFDLTDAFVIVQEQAGLAAAIEIGLDTATDFGIAGRGTAVLLGDLPGLTSAELGAALDDARRFDRAMVPDAAGTGTTLITAADGQLHSPRFGDASAAAHVAAGYAVLDVPADSGLRRDVDTRTDLEALGSRVGIHTTAALR